MTPGPGRGGVRGERPRGHRDPDRFGLHRDQDRADRPAAGSGAAPWRRRRSPGGERLAGRHRPSAAAIGAVGRPVGAVRLAGASPPSASPVRGPGRATRSCRPTASSARWSSPSRTTLGPIEAQASLTTIGAVVSSDLLRQALILIVVGSLGIVAWITYRFRDVKFGVTALVVARSMTSSSSSARSRSSARSSTSRSTRCS